MTQAKFYGQWLRFHNSDFLYMLLWLLHIDACEGSILLSCYRLHFCLCSTNLSLLSLNQFPCRGLSSHTKRKWDWSGCTLTSLGSTENTENNLTFISRQGYPHWRIPLLEPLAVGFRRKSNCTYLLFDMRAFDELQTSNTVNQREFLWIQWSVL